MWEDLQSDMMTKLDGITIDDLCNQANRQGVESEGRQNLDFSI
jgi:Rrf2 family iron-sulfur cluster assembly transcriptional regulator